MGFRPVSEKALLWPPLSAASAMLYLSVSFAGFCLWYSVESPFPAAEFRGWGGAVFVPHLQPQRSGMTGWGLAGLAVPQSTATVRWIHGT